MLSERDRRTLAEIERRLYAEDPGLVRRLEAERSRVHRRGGRESTSGRGRARAAAPYLATVLVPLLLVAVVALEALPLLVEVAVVLALAGLAVRLVRGRRRR